MTERNACQLTEGPFYQCCCNCAKHWQDFHHCAMDDALYAEKGGCVCSVPKGWICAGLFVEGGMKGPLHSGWPEHSCGCEMYQPIKIYERPKETV